MNTFEHFSDFEGTDALPALNILNPEPAEFFASNTVIKQSGENSPITFALERIFGRRIQQLSGLGIA